MVGPAAAMIIPEVLKIGTGIWATRDAAKQARAARRYQEGQQRNALGAIDTAAGRYSTAIDPYTDVERMAMDSDAARRYGTQYGNLAGDVRADYARRGLFQGGAAINREASVRGQGIQATGEALRGNQLAQILARRQEEMARRDALARLDQARASILLGAPPPAQADYSGAAGLFSSGMAGLSQELSPDTKMARQLNQAQLDLYNSDIESRRMQRYLIPSMQPAGFGPVTGSF